MRERLYALNIAARPDTFYSPPHPPSIFLAAAMYFSFSQRMIVMFVRIVLSSPLLLLHDTFPIITCEYRYRRRRV